MGGEVSLQGFGYRSALTELDGKHAVVLGGAGFLGSHVCSALVEAGAGVTCLDNMITGTPTNVDHLMGNSRFRFIDYDVTDSSMWPGTSTMCSTSHRLPPRSTI